MKRNTSGLRIIFLPTACNMSFTTLRLSFMTGFRRDALPPGRNPRQKLPTRPSPESAPQKSASHFRAITSFKPAQVDSACARLRSSS